MSLLFGRNKNTSENSTPKSDQSIASSALQKALERNRLKLAANSLEKGEGPRPANYFQQLDNANQPVNEAKRPVVPFEEKLKQLQADVPPKEILLTQKPLTSPFGANSSLSNNRISSTSNLSNPVIGPGNIKSPPNRWETIKSNLFSYFLKGLWIFSIVLLLRLIFAERGVLEYYFRRKKVQEKLGVLENQNLVNKKISKELIRIQKDNGHQKSLVRNHLGFIADDEFIIVLPERKKN